MGRTAIRPWRERGERRRSQLAIAGQSYPPPSRVAENMGDTGSLVPITKGFTGRPLHHEPCPRIWILGQLRVKPQSLGCGRRIPCHRVLERPAQTTRLTVVRNQPPWLESVAHKGHPTHARPCALIRSPGGLNELAYRRHSFGFPLTSLSSPPDSRPAPTCAASHLSLTVSNLSQLSLTVLFLSSPVPFPLASFALLFFSPCLFVSTG